MSVGEKIKKYLDDNGIMQSHLSEKTGMSPSKLNLALNGKRNLKYEEYEMICWVLNVGTNKFLEPRKPKLVEQPPRERR